MEGEKTRVSVLDRLLSMYVGGERLEPATAQAVAAVITDREGAPGTDKEAWVAAKLEEVYGRLPPKEKDAAREAVKSIYTSQKFEFTDLVPLDIAELTALLEKNEARAEQESAEQDQAQAQEQERNQAVELRNLLDMLYQLEDQKNYALLIQEAAKALARFPDNAEISALRDKALTQARLEQEQERNRALELQNLLGKLYLLYEQKNYALLIQEAAKALARFPYNAEISALRDKALTQARLEQEQARTEQERLEQDRNRALELQNLLGKLYQLEDQKNYALLIPEAAKALARFPDNAKITALRDMALAQAQLELELEQERKQTLELQNLPGIKKTMEVKFDDEGIKGFIKQNLEPDENESCHFIGAIGALAEKFYIFNFTNKGIHLYEFPLTLSTSVKIKGYSFIQKDAIKKITAKDGLLNMNIEVEYNQGGKMKIRVPKKLPGIKEQEKNRAAFVKKYST